MAETNPVALNSPKRWKAISHPLRLAILGALDSGDKTNEELAKALDVASGKLYFHTKTLLDAGLIELSGTRQKGSVTEKLYRRTSPSFEIPMVDDGTAPPLLHFVENAARLYETAWRETPPERRDFVQFGFHVLRYLSEARALEFCDRLTALLDEFEDAGQSPDAPGARLVSFVTLLHQSEPEGHSR